MANSPIRIWFNRTYATSYWLLRQLKANSDGVEVRLYATHVDATSPVLAVADVRESEPDVDGEVYVQWALDFCQRNDIQLLVPRAHQLELVAAATRFEAQGVTLIAPPEATIRLFEDKVAAYEAATRIGLTLPPYRSVRSRAGLLKAHAELTSQLGEGAELVLKPAVGVGAEGFRILTPQALTIADLLATHDNRVRLHHAADALSAEEALGREVQELLLMPRLGDPEISLDALTSPSGKLMGSVARIKETPRRTRLGLDERALAQVQQLHSAHPFAYISNFQFMHWRGEPVLLEVNTRPAGGLHALEAAGVELLWEAIRLALGMPERELHPELGSAYAQVDFPVILDEAAHQVGETNSSSTSSSSSGSLPVELDFKKK